jgi:hypothetical protein
VYLVYEERVYYSVLDAVLHLRVSFRCFTGVGKCGVVVVADQGESPLSDFIPFLDPQMPIISKADNRLVLDVEGLVANQDGTCVILFLEICGF